MRLRSASFVSLGLAFALGVVIPSTAGAQADKPRPRSSTKPADSTLAAPVAERAAEILASLDTPKPNLKAALRQSEELLDWVIAYADPKTDASAFRSAVLVHRQVYQLACSPKGRVGPLAALLRACPTFASRLAFILRHSIESHTPGKVFELLDRLAESLGPKSAETIEMYAELAAAVCVVHDNPTPRRVNENRVLPPDGVQVFRSFIANERSLAFGLKNVPAGLLIYVVDASASIPEQDWARRQFAREASIAPLYDKVRYDYSHIYQGTPKRISREGFNLQNIFAWGGVCADQAYFTSEVAKSLGIPACMVTGRDDTVGHAWVGLLEVNKGVAGWNFDIGRYSAYQRVRGNVIDPMTGGVNPDGVLDVLAASFKQPPSEREESYALAEAGLRLASRAKDEKSAAIQPDRALIPGLPEGVEPRAVTLKSALDLIRVAVEKSPSSLDGWWAAASLSRAGGMTMQDRKEWAAAVERLCGRQYPDFTWTILDSLIASIDDPKQQDPIWEKTFQLFAKTRPDLAANVRFRQARIWEEKGDPARSWAAYQDIIEQYANESPATIPALTACRTLLEKNGKDAQIIPLYEDTWRRIRVPALAFSPEFRRQSNWYRVGSAYASLLQKAGRIQEAEAVRAKLNAR